MRPAQERSPARGIVDLGTRGATLALIVALFCASASRAAETAPPGANANYLKLHPDIIANLDGGGQEVHFLMATVEVMSRSPDTIERVRPHIPALRHRLLMLFSDQRFPAIGSADAQRELQSAALGELNEHIRDELGSAHELEGLYFTSLVVE